MVMNKSPNNSEEYITIKDIFLKIQSYISEVYKFKYLLLVVGFLAGAIMAYRTFIKPAMYSEKLTFMMDEKSGDAVQGLNLLGGLFGGAKSGENLSRILELFESKKIIHNTLFDTIEINGTRDFLANHIFEEYGIQALVNSYKRIGSLYRVGWPKRLLENKDFRFNHGDVNNFTDRENLYLRLLFEKITGSTSANLPRLLNSSLDEDSGIMTISMTSERQEITLGVLKNIYQHLSSFFIEKSVEKQTKTYNIIKMKKDSVLTELKSSEYQLADFKDSNRKLVTVKGYLKQLRLEREVAILNVMYAEAVKQMEATDFALKNKTPVVQVIDLPRRPIFGAKDSFIRSFVFGSMFAMVLLTVFIVLRKFVLDVLSE